MTHQKATSCRLNWKREWSVCNAISVSRDCACSRALILPICTNASSCANACSFFSCFSSSVSSLGAKCCDASRSANAACVLRSSAGGCDTAPESTDCVNRGPSSLGVRSPRRALSPPPVRSRGSRELRRSPRVGGGPDGGRGPTRGFVCGRGLSRGGLASAGSPWFAVASGAARSGLRRTPTLRRPSLSAGSGGGGGGGRWG
mmetsp:Transcript_3356/g.10309  ORF Transcript_3356/g.10309 Transcript_3356/m.10309 type:complete len:202 (+) Transcript_3356:58-663(+)